MEANLRAWFTPKTGRRRLVFTVGVILLFYPSLITAQVTGHEGLHLLSLIWFLVLFWTPERWRHTLFYGLAGLGTILFAVWNWHSGGGNQINVYLFMPLMAVLGLAPSRKVVLTSSIVLCSLGFMMLLNHGQLSSMIWTCVGYIGLFLGVRSRTVRLEVSVERAAYVAQLEDTLCELQATQLQVEESATQAMRYAAQAERARIARDIHDGLGHRLTSLIVQLQALGYAKNAEEQATRTQRLLQLAKESLGEVRKAVRTWEQEVDDGLAALRAVADEMADSSGLAITFQADIPQPHDWPAPVQVCLYRILQEALTNIVRHARAQSIDIALKEQPGHVLLTVSDDGKYSEEQPIIPGFGLRNMASRCRELGGTCTWQAAAPAGGLSLSINLPLLQNTHIREGTR